ncbi:M15 family metallopeptidase [Nocardioides sp. cx-173]|uniref:M15 family metallopeptidase n=1 Tax=Nocardioides sp. cx-173 TaxID=2898796 RepID=UPI001E44F705|nr:M15 family metallopeptidase [Nocardioides sp. cx-173]MCD4524857.1 M15 family metallopeptidase [Nocardioides sp. cx-173]UGB43361.1 M15 family metallopeptidase [Nocardioides sp. cx-173]
MTYQRSRSLLIGVLLLVAVVTLACGGGDGEAGDRSAPSGSSDVPPAPAGDLPATDGEAGAFDTSRAGVARLDPDLREAVVTAARDARRAGVPMVVTSGWRSREHQQRLYDEAVATYGSDEEARRYVATPDTSAHVTGDAVDLGPTDALSWLSQHGSRYGLCQTFANEMWHYELSTSPGGECPPMLADGRSRG